jgi:alkanesulfonate monooxygenase SsuD/methylene tetrahydromethanopterin reductase-like flavin-dependent oxidoreductase (luciferase family)
MSESRGRYNECLEVLTKAMSNEWFSHDGEFFKIPLTSIRPMFRNPERLLERLRVAWTSPESMPLAANAGLGMLMTGQKSFEEYRVDVDTFNAIRAERGWDPVQPTIVVRAACFETEAEAWDVMRRYTFEGQRSSSLHYEFGDVKRFSETKGYEQYAKLGEHTRTEEEIVETAARPQAWGTPDQVIERLRAIQEQVSAEEFVMSFRMASMPLDQAERSMRLFAEEVLPTMKAMEAALNFDPGNRREPEPFSV